MSETIGSELFINKTDKSTIDENKLIKRKSLKLKNDNLFGEETKINFEVKLMQENVNKIIKNRLGST